MVTTDELLRLIDKARERGATVRIEWDVEAQLEGRVIPERITIGGLPGVGPHPMGLIACAECLRAVLAK